MTEGLFRIRLDVTAENADAALALALGTGVQGVEIRDAETGGPEPGRVHIILWHADPHEGPAHRREVVEGLLTNADLDVRVSVSEQNGEWAALLARDMAPIRLGARFSALAPGGIPEPGRTPLWLESGGGFGSGMHPTTALCVDLLESRVGTTTRVLDIGCGSGVLAIVALLLGAESAIGVDIDPVALAAAARNGVHNGVQKHCTWREDMPTDRAHLVLANLYPGPLTALASTIAARVHEDGLLLISGFRAPQRPALETLYGTHGLHVVDAQTRAGWHGLIFKFHSEVSSR